MLVVYMLLDGVTRVIPIILLLYATLNVFLYRSCTWLLWTLLVSEGFNLILKEVVFRAFLGKHKRLPLFGVGERPPGAHDCGPFSTYGMPSGHAQAVAVFSTFMILVAWNMRQPLLQKIVASSFFVLCAATVMYSRVAWAGCHTYGQVVLGALIGCLVGTGSYTVRALTRS